MIAKAKFEQMYDMMIRLRYMLKHSDVRVSEDAKNNLETAIRHLAILITIPAKNYENDVCSDVIDECENVIMQFRKEVA